jgi:hypothetical protein
MMCGLAAAVARKRGARRSAAQAPADDEHIEGRIAVRVWHARNPVGRGIAPALEITPGFGSECFKAAVWGYWPRAFWRASLGRLGMAN